jgi:hypothetical protein
MSRPVQPHPPGWHKTELARRRCYACSNPAQLTPAEGDVVLVRALIAQGYLSVSNSRRAVARLNLPAFEQVFAFEGDDVPKWLQDELRDWYDGSRGHWTRMHGATHGDRRELTAAQFHLFKKLGGRSA